MKLALDQQPNSSSTRHIDMTTQSDTPMKIPLSDGFTANIWPSGECRIQHNDGPSVLAVASEKAILKALTQAQDALTAERAKNAKLRDEVLEEAAKAVEGEICGCCWDDDAQAFAEHAAETLRAMKEKK